jgi:hypothetical protein
MLESSMASYPMAQSLKLARLKTLVDLSKLAHLSCLVWELKIGLLQE